MFECIEVYDNLSTTGVLEKIEHRVGLRLPDFAETRDFLKAYPKEYLAGSIVSICGCPHKSEGLMRVACVYIIHSFKPMYTLPYHDYDDRPDRWLYFDTFDINNGHGGRWSMLDRFLIIHK